MCPPALCNTSPKQMSALLICIVVFNLTFWLWAEPAMRAFLQSIRRSHAWIEDWPISYGVVVFFGWCLLTCLVVFIWYVVIQWYRLRDADSTSRQCLHDKGSLDSEKEAREAVTKRVKSVGTALNEKARRTLGVDLSPSKGSSEDLQKAKHQTNQNPVSTELTPERNGRKVPSDLTLDVTALPECRPDTIVSIFNFDETAIKENENQRKHPPFQEYLELVHVDSPSTPRVVSLIEKEKNRMSAYKEKLQNVEVHKESEVEHGHKIELHKESVTENEHDRQEPDNAKEEGEILTTPRVENVENVEVHQESQTEQNVEVHKESKIEHEKKKESEIEDEQVATLAKEGTFWTTPIVVRKSRAQTTAGLEGRKSLFAPRKSVMIARVTEGQINDVVLPGKFKLLSDPSVVSPTMIP